MDSFTALASGNYTVIVQDANGCSSNATTTIAISTPLTFTVQTDSTLCNGSSDGQVIITVTNGTPGYQYALNNGANQGSNTFANLAAGNYSVLVTDANGCTATNPATVGQPPVLILSLTETDPLCFGGSNGSITAFAHNGHSPYQYALNGGANQASGLFSNLAAGSYSVIVTDLNSCTANSSINLGQPTAIILNEVSVDVSCFGASDGTIQLTTIGGTTPYIYSWNDGVNTQNRTGLAPGNYSITLTDANQCTASTSASISQGPPLVFGTASINPSCASLPPDGRITVTPTGGTLPYTYHWSNGGPDFSTLYDVGPGTYSVTVSDAHNCTQDTTLSLAYL